METLTKTELSFRFQEIIEKIKQGALFLHPTDTIYGIGCNALDAKAIQKVRNLKERQEDPFSVWVPSKAWIKDNCETEKAKEWLDRLPGPYTLLLPLKNEVAIANNVAPKMKKIGIRIPDHWFREVLEKAEIPIITTSANKAGEPFMTSLENLDPEIEKGVDFIIYEGPKTGRPSKIVDIEKEEVKER